MTKENREYRMMQLGPATEKRLESDHYVEGYATTFNDPYVLFERDGIKFSEQIDARALDGADLSDVIFKYDHQGKVLARRSNNTLGIETDARGLFVYADLSKSIEARNMYEEIDSGLVDKMSWAFTVARDEYDKESRTRIIKQIKKVYDVSAVSIPANPSADISARSYFDGVIEVEKQELLARERQVHKIKIMTEV